MILKRKSLREPGPSTYKVKDSYKPRYLPMSTHELQHVMLENARWYGLQTPGHKYNPDILKASRPRSSTAIMASKPRDHGTRFKDTRMQKLTKDKSKPDMGTY